MFTSFLVVVYNGLATKILAVFVCTELIDGTSMLDASKDMNCWEPGHIVLVVVSVLLGFVYILGTCPAVLRSLSN